MENFSVSCYFQTVGDTCKSVFIVTGISFLRQAAKPDSLTAQSQSAGWYSQYALILNRYVVWLLDSSLQHEKRLQSKQQNSTQHTNAQAGSNFGMAPNHQTLFTTYVHLFWASTDYGSRHCRRRYFSSLLKIWRSITSIPLDLENHCLTRSPLATPETITEAHGTSVSNKVCQHPWHFHHFG